MSEYVGLGLGSELYMSSVATERKKNWVRVRPPRFRMRNLNPNPAFPPVYYSDVAYALPLLHCRILAPLVTVYKPLVT